MQRNETDRDHAIAALDAHFVRANNGLPLANVATVARLANCHPNTIRTAAHTGQLVVSRRAPNGPMTIRLRELARWIVDGERNSLPQ